MYWTEAKEEYKHGGAGLLLVYKDSHGITWGGLWKYSDLASRADEYGGVFISPGGETATVRGNMEEVKREVAIGCRMAGSGRE